MVTTCFFCQNLLSDYVEGILPAIRHEEIKKHLSDCKECDQIHKELISSVAVLKEFPSPSISPEFSVRIIEASEAGTTSALRPLRLSRNSLAYVIPVLLIVSLFLISSKIFPWFSWLQSQSEEKQLVRYFPMSNGAGEILEEQANWVHSREPRVGSVWEEGGLSPDEFEKSFQKKGVPAEVSDSKEEE
jgi:hypothetical protein